MNIGPRGKSSGTCIDEVQSGGMSTNCSKRLIILSSENLLIAHLPLNHSFFEIAGNFVKLAVRRS
ncbi:predicted protein [Botrytis cinerea T4]|uniref:Uncharacterized protein n=1 Tax=Botryotinia fuckeliana (strain T4) TaxID=999810 RepID=G2YJY8_BOTF4|nr:predicted protein [Botrytis cinerea T4]